jgi:chromosome partitioning related protein ParA
MPKPFAEKAEPGLVVTICSTKGGAGKTTLTANMGGLLVDLGQRVLLIDCDVQPTLSSYYQLTSQSEKGLVDVFVESYVTEAISHTEIGADIILSNDPNGELPRWIMQAPDGIFRLKRILKQLTDYDFILVDTQGTIGPLQDAAVLAADLLISPIPPELLSAREFARGTISMLERLSNLEYMGFPLGNLFGVIYRMDRTVNARDTAEVLRKSSFGPSKGKILIMDTVVPAAVAYREAAGARMPVHRWNKKQSIIMQALVRELPFGLEDAQLRIDQDRRRVEA